jgi:hypothetical protein
MLDPAVQAALVVIVAALLKWLLSFLPFQLPFDDAIFNAIAGAIVAYLLGLFFTRLAARTVLKGLVKRGLMSQE